MRKFFQIFVVGALVSFLFGCQLSQFGGDKKEKETKLLINMLLSDMPLPKGSSIQTEKTIIFGSGGGWAGRLVVHAPHSQIQSVLFFREQAIGAGWQLLSSTIASSMILVYRKDDRYSTIEIFERSNIFFSGSKFTITVVPSLTNDTVNKALK